MIHQWEMPDADTTDEEKIIKMYVSQLKKDFSKEADFPEMINACMLTVSEGQALCKKVIKYASDRAIAISAYELLTCSYAAKHREKALQCIEDIIDEVTGLSRYSKNARLLFAYNVKSSLANDESYQYKAKDISLARCENDSSLSNLIKCCDEFADTLREKDRTEEAIFLYHEMQKLYSRIDEVNYFNLKELFENLSSCYNKINDVEKAEFYKKEAGKYSSISISVGSVSQTNIIEDLDVFFQTESMHIFHGFRNCTLHDLTDEEHFRKFEEHFISFVDDFTASLENSEEEFRDFDTCHKILLSILSGERQVVKNYLRNQNARYVYDEALCYRDGTNGKDRDMNKSFELLQKAYEMGSIAATTELLVDGIDEVKRNNGERYTVKQMEKAKKNLEVKLAKLNDQSRKDDVVTFEELGIDRLFVDEAHYYKEL